MFEESGKRLIGTHPHTGRVFVAGDTFTIMDAWMASDAYKNALDYGSTWVNEGVQAWNPGSYRNEGAQVTDRLMHHEPVVGMSGGNYSSQAQQTEGYRFIRKANTYVADFGGEINSQHDSYALALDFRFISELEFSQGAQAGHSGIGARAQRIKISLIEKSNPSLTQLQVLADIFYDKSYYALNVSPVVPAANAPELVDLNPTNGWPFPQNGEINSLLWIDKIAAALRKNGSSAAQLQIAYELPLAPNGQAWSTISGLDTFYWCHAESLQHPNSGVFSQAWGVLSVTFTCFRSDTYTQPVLGIGSHGRTQTAFPLTADYILGRNLSGDLFTDLQSKGNAVKSVSFPSFFGGFRDFGGLLRPLMGDVSRFQPGNLWQIDHTGTQTNEFWIQVPQGVTRFTIYSKVRYSTGGGLHTIAISLTRDYTTILGANAQATQTLYTASFASGLPATWIWIDQPLSANMSPDQGQVERLKLTLTVTKSTPVALAASTFQYWDGIGALYLAFR